MKRFSLVALPIILMFSACENKEVITDEEVPKPEMTLVSSASVELPYTEGDDVVTFKTNRKWSAECDASWMTLRSTYGSANDEPVSIYVHYQENASNEERSATVTIIPEDGDKLVVNYTQAGTPYMNVLYDDNFYVGPDGGIVEYKVQTNVEFDVVPQNDWIHYIETKGIEDKTVVLEIDPYEITTYRIRNGEVLLRQKDGKSLYPCYHIIVNQDGPNFYFYKPYHFVPLEGGEVEFLGNSNVYFEVETQSDWIHYVKTNTYDNNVFGVVLRFDRNESGPRTGTVTGLRKSKNPITVFSLEQYGRIPVPEAVDMGLSVKWASFNLGATNPEEVGYFYMWGETTPALQSTWEGYKWCDGNNPPTGFYKYNTNPNLGNVDNITRLDLEDDAASYILGGNWRIPTPQEFNALKNETNFTWTKTQVGGINGYRVTSKKTGNSIFLPFSHWKRSVDKDAGQPADFFSLWSSDLGDYDPSFWAICFVDLRGYPECLNTARCNLESIRPVTD